MSGLEHPRWCDRQDCAERLEHRSPARPANPAGDELYAVTVALVQLTAAPAPLPVVVELTFTAAPDEAVVTVLSLGQAAALTYRIRSLIEAARGGRR